MKIVGVTLLMCFLFAFTIAQSTNIQLDVFEGSNRGWLAIAVRNAGVDTRSVQIKESGSSSWRSTRFYPDWGYFTISSDDRFRFPVSVRLTSVNGAQVTINNIIASASVGVVDTGATYSGSSATTTPSSAPTSRPATASPTTASTVSPTSSATTKPPATSNPTVAATTKATAAATTKPATAAPTSKPATAAPTTKPTTSSSSSGCTAPIKMLVPLYMYPGSQWDTVIASASKVKTVAIINPNSGPGTSGPDSAFRTYMTKFDQAGIEMVGYVHTSYGARDIATVKQEIDEYASKFTSVVGIFLDEVSAADAQLSYYKELYQYIMSMPGWKYDVINPGAVPTVGYLDAATQIVSFETDASQFASSSNPSFASCANKDKFSIITYGASSSMMQSVVNTARSKGWYGWVYATDAGLNGGTYNSLPSYYAAMAQYIASTN